MFVGSLIFNQNVNLFDNMLKELKGLTVLPKNWRRAIHINFPKGAFRKQMLPSSDHVYLLGHRVSQRSATRWHKSFRELTQEGRLTSAGHRLSHRKKIRMC